MEQNTDYANILASRRSRADGDHGANSAASRTVGDTSRGNVLSRDGMTRALYTLTFMLCLVAGITMWH